MFAKDVLKTLYSPVKAFEEIVKKPDIKGPLLILVLTLIITAGLQYASSSKIFDEEPMTNRDEWTEPAWIPQWTSNGELAGDNDTFINNYVSNHSIASSVTNSTYIWMKLTNIGSFPEFERLSFLIKWTYQNDPTTRPNATLKLFSDNDNDYFASDFETWLSNSSDEWSIIKADLGPNSEGWMAVGSPDWENIEGLEFGLVWLDSADLTMKIDDLYFAKFVPLTQFFSAGWLSSMMMEAGGFFILWGIYGGVLLLIIRLVIGEKGGSWKSLFVVVGYLFSVRIVYLLVTVVLIPMLPEVRLENLAQIWYSTPQYQVIFYLSFITDAWIAALSAIAVRSFYSFTWKKAIGIAVLAGLLNLTLRPLIPI